MLDVMTTLLYIYIAGAFATLLLAIWLAHKEKVETPWLLSIFISNEVTMILFGALWPILAPIVIAEIMFRGCSKAEKGKALDDTKQDT
jgi:hypothetical protein